MNNKNKSNGGLLRTRQDKLIAIILAVVLIAFAGTAIMNFMGGQNKNNSTKEHKNTMQLSKKDKASMEKTIESFIVNSGTFGFDWSQSNQDTDLEPIRTAWSMNVTSNADMPEDISRMVKTRSQAITSLLQPSENGGSSPLDPSSKMASISKADMNLQSDPLWLSGFKVDPESIDIDWRNAVSAPGDNGRTSTVIEASWKTSWTRTKTIPAAITGTKPAEWGVTTDSITLKNVKFTLNKTSVGDWQVYAMNDDQGSLSLHDHQYVTATSGQLAYDQDGKITTRSQDTSSDYDDNDDDHYTGDGE